MPNIKSAKKRLRQNIARRHVTQGVQSLIKTKRRTFNEALSGKDAGAGLKAYQTYCSVLDKAAKKGVIKKNTASRRKKWAADKLRVNA